MRVHVDIGGSEALELKGALLVYQGHSRSFVSWHEVQAAAEPGAPYLGEATPVSMEFVQQQTYTAVPHHAAEKPERPMYAYQ